MAKNENTRTVTVVTIFYKEEYLSSLVFDDTETGDAAITTLQEIFDFRNDSQTVHRGNKIELTVIPAPLIREP